MDRDPEFEAALLTELAAAPGFCEQVLGRLQATEDLKGNDGWERPVEQLLGEVLEEAADVAGWGIGAAYQLEAAGRGRLIVAMRLGAAAWREVSELLELLAARSVGASTGRSAGADGAVPGIPEVTNDAT